MANRKYIFDFDSTFIQTEGFDELLKFIANKNPEHQGLLEDITQETDRSMNGQHSFRESLEHRLRAFPLHKDQIEEVALQLKEQVSSSFLRNQSFFKEHKDDIYIVSGGFIEFIWPIAKMFNLHYDHVFANQFLYDFNGYVHDFDRANPLSQDKGKVILLQQLKLPGDIVVIGDGYNDYEMKEAGLVSTFFAYTENVIRDNVCKVADGVFSDLEGVFLACGIETSSPPPIKKALLLENIHPFVEAHFKSHGFEVESHAGSLGIADLKRSLQDISILGIRSKTQINKELIECAPKLEAIGAFCIGTNHIDLTASLEKGIGVFNAPFSNTRSVVELALGEIIMLLRRIAERNDDLHRGQWKKSAAQSYEARGKTLGIIGYGNIGSQLSILAESLGMHVLFYDLEEKLPLGNAKSCIQMTDLLKQSDIVTLHVDGRASNHHLIDAAMMSQMKDQSYLLNLSRGHVVDLDALKVMLDNKKIAGAALDVYPSEPQTNNDTFHSPLQEYPQVILTPHIGGSTKEAQFNIGQFVAHRLQEFSQLGATVNCVNLPQLQLPAIQGSNRIIHTHRNVPGILAKINSLFAAHNINIVGQYLKTNESIGYVITDISEPGDHELIQRLRDIEQSICIRVLY